jgi:Tfp pilus assembly protein PilO
MLRALCARLRRAGSTNCYTTRKCVNSQHDSSEQYQEKGMHLHYNGIYDQNRSFHAKVAQFKNSPFGVNTKIELKNITTAFDNTDIWQAMF